MVDAINSFRFPKYCAVVSAAALLMLSVNGPAKSQTNGEGAPGMSSSLTGIDKAVHSFLAANGYPGATVAVTRAGRLVWSKGYGVADKVAGTEMQPWHRSRIGSVSKMLTALAALKLAEAGTLDLSQSIYGDPGPYISNNDPWPGNNIAWGVLQNTGDYWDAMKTGVENLYEQNFFNSKMNETIDWAKQITVPHLLSHTSGFQGSGDAPGAAAYYKKSEYDLTYKEAHLFVLMGLRKNKDGLIAPFASAPGTQWAYSNHGPGLAGMIVDELAGPGVTFRQYVEQNILHPLGLTDVVPNSNSIDKLDAFPHGADLNDAPNILGLASGGWSASATDLVRVMCGIDKGSNNLRLLSNATVKIMESDVVPSIPGPMGWDSRSGGKLSKNGSIGGGIALIQKFLPGEVSDDEINVAVAVNSSGDAMPGALIQSIANAAASAYIPSEYDLFDPAYRCYNPGPQRFDITSVTLTGFYPAGTSNPLPAKIVAKCPVNINLKGTFHHIGKGKVEYRFRFLVENKASTTFSTVIKGDPKDPLYEQPTVTHTIQLPLPAAINPGGKGGAIPKGPGGFQVLEQPEEPIFPGKPKGPAVPGKVVVNQPGSGAKGTVRLEVQTPTGGLMSNPVHYDIECEPDMAIESGVVQLRDDNQKAPACPRPASVAVSLRTNKAGPVPYVLACSGGREWNGKTEAKETAPDTFIGVAIHPIQIAKQEEVTCVLRRGEQFGFADILATDKQLYPCKVTGVTTPPYNPPPPPPSGLKQPEPPAPPRLVCVGGRVVGAASRQTCACPVGQEAEQTAPNRFECETKLICDGGRIINRGRPPQPSCICPAGMTAQKVEKPSRAGSRVRQLANVVGRDSEPEHYRCVRKPTVPDKKTTTTVAPKITCAGGVMRSNVCVCPRGTTLQAGVCRAPARVR